MDRKQREDDGNAVLVGRSVQKFFRGHGCFSGRVISYDRGRKFFRVKYADGDKEELELHELKAILVKRPRGRPKKTPQANSAELDSQNGEVIQDYHGAANDLKRPLEELAAEIQVPDEAGRCRKKARTTEEADQVHEAEICRKIEEGQEQVSRIKPPDCSSPHRRKSCLVEYRLRRTPLRQQDFKQQVLKHSLQQQQVEKYVTESDLNIPALPPSSISFNVPMESVLHLFSAYTFLRSFSWVVFLSPFSMREFVRCLTIQEANPLVDQIHLSLMLLLRQHVENLAKDGVEAASICLRCRDWNFLDAVTWPSYLLVYLLSENYELEGKMKLVEAGILKGDYYGLEAGTKIRILSFLCDRVLDTDEARSELSKRTDADSEADFTEAKTPLGRTVSSDARDSDRRTRGCKDTSDQAIAAEEQAPALDWNSDDCVLCGMDGNLICCDGCPGAYHSRCVGVSGLPEGDWYCPECLLQRTGTETTRIRKALRGFESLGLDAYGRRYVAVCEHLFISKSTGVDSVYVCYGPSDILTVLELLESSGALSSVLRENVIQHWNIADDSILEKNTTDEAVPDTSFCIQNAAGTEPLLKLSADNKLGSLGKNGPGRLQDEVLVYVNHYASGAWAASAASRLGERSGNKKASVQRAQISEQIAAFSQGPLQFYWPSFKKKQAPKDRCGWCFACKNLSRKKGCLINTAAGKVSAGAAIVAGGLRPTKKGFNHFPALSSYILSMEERLSGLLAGAWENPEQRRRWRKRVENADNVKQLKSALTEFGLSLRSLALSKNWSDFSEDAPKLIPPSLHALVAPRRPGRRRKILQEDEDEAMKWIFWWRGGKLVRRFQDWERLPTVMLKRAARQGGAKKIVGLLYNENYEIPRRTAKCAWGARVEFSFSVSELAIQVRYLDALIRWPELSVPQEARIYLKKTMIREKVFQGDEISYLVDSSKSESEFKDLLKPEVTSSALKFLEILVGEDEDQCSNRVWLPETQLPLCLVREFEEKWRSNLKAEKSRKKTQTTRIEKVLKTSKLSAVLNKLHLDKVETKKELLNCEECNLELSVSDRVCCQECQGDFHKDCLISSNKSAADSMCHSCFSVKRSKRSRRQTSKAAEPPRISHAETELTDNYFVKPLTSKPLMVYTRRRRPKTNGIGRFLVKKKRSKRAGSGVRWKIQTKFTYDRNKVFFPRQGGGLLQGPQCAICLQPYDPRRLYVGCEDCQEWFHGRAIGVTDRNIGRVAAFKCHKCRRKAPPLCLYEQRNDKGKELVIDEAESKDFVKSSNEQGDV